MAIKKVPAKAKAAPIVLSKVSKSLARTKPKIPTEDLIQDMKAEVHSLFQNLEKERAMMNSLRSKHDRRRTSSSIKPALLSEKPSPQLPSVRSPETAKNAD